MQGFIVKHYNIIFKKSLINYLLYDIKLKAGIWHSNQLKTIISIKKPQTVVQVYISERLDIKIDKSME